MLKTLVKPWAIATWAGLALVLCGSLRWSAFHAALAADQYEDRYYLPDPAWLRVFSLGHTEALADLIWCRALVYQGEEFLHRGTLANVFRYADAMLALDPDFRAAYLWIGNAGVYQPQEVTAAEVRRAIEYLERAHERFPNDGEIAWVLGATWSFELAPLLPESERDDARLRGTEYLMEAARLGAAPDWLVLSNTSQLAALGRADLAVRHLEEMYANVSDEQVRLQIAERIREVRSEAYQEAFVEANDLFEIERIRRYPYVHPSLYFLIAPSPEEDWRAVFREGYARAVLGGDILVRDVDDEK